MIIDKIYLRKVLLIELNVLFDPFTYRAKNAISPPSSKIVRIKVLRTSKASLFFAKTFLSQKYRQISRQSKGVSSANFAQTINKTFAKIPLCCVICKKPFCNDFKHATSWRINVRRMNLKSRELYGQ